MEEALFSSSCSYDKKTCKAFGRADIKSKRTLFIYYWIGILMIVANGLLDLFGLSDVGEILFLPGMVLSVLPVVFTWFTPSLVYRNLHKTKRDLNHTMLFYEDSFAKKDELSEGTGRYETIEKILEGNEAFYLYINKVSAFIIPKNTLGIGTIEGFSAFLQRKTGLKIKKVKDSPKPLQKAAAFLLPFLLFVGLTVLPFFVKIPKTFHDEAYSIVLDTSFEENMDWEEDDDDFYSRYYSLDSNVEVYVMPNDPKETAKQYIEKTYLKKHENAQDIEIKEISPNECRVSYRETDESLPEDDSEDLSEEYTQAYFYVSVIKNGEDLWLFRFTDYLEDDQTEQSFSDFADSIILR